MVVKIQPILIIIFNKKNALDFTGDFGVMRHLSKEDLEEFRIEIICNEALKTSEIEGEILDRDSLQLSICKEFGVGEKYLHGNIKPEEAGIAMMMKDLYTNFDSLLTNEILYSWHDKLLNGRTDIERGTQQYHLKHIKNK